METTSTGSSPNTACARAPALREPGLANPWFALCVIALVCASLLLCVRTFRLSDDAQTALLVSNTLKAAQRKRWLLQVLAAALTPIVLSTPFLLWRREPTARVLRALAQRLAPLSLAFTLPSLLDAQQWYSKPLPYLSVLLAVVLVLERLLEPALLPLPRGLGRLQPRLWAGTIWVERLDRAKRRAVPLLRRAAPLGIVLLAAAGYAAYMAHFTIMRHQRLGSSGFDLGIFDNLMVNALEGRPFYSSVAVPKGSYLSNHAEYGMFLFAPLYFVWPGADTLLVLQSLFMGAAAIPLYFFATTQVSRAAAAALACAYLLYAPLHGPNFFDFHWMPMSMFCFFWLFHALATRRRWTAVVLMLVICSLREDAPFGLIATGMFLIATGSWPRFGVVLCAVPGAWFVLVKFVIMPWAGPWWFAEIYKELMAPGEKGYGSVVRSMLVNPSYFLKTLLSEEKLTFALHLFAPLALLPLRRSALWLLMLPGFVVTLMTTAYRPTLSIAFQYTTHWIPFLFAATAIALGLRARSLGPAAMRASLLALGLGVLCHSYVFGAILQRETFVGGFSRVQFQMSDHERRRYADLVAVKAAIPPRASVAATEQEVPHVSTRPNTYTLKVTAGDADYVFINKHHLDAEARQHFQDALDQHPYRLIKRQGEYMLFQRSDASDADTDSTLRRLRLRKR